MCFEIDRSCILCASKELLETKLATCEEQQEQGTISEGQYLETMDGLKRLYDSAGTKKHCKNCVYNIEIKIKGKRHIDVERQFNSDWLTLGYWLSPLRKGVRSLETDTHMGDHRGVADIRTWTRIGQCLYQGINENVMGEILYSMPQAGWEGEDGNYTLATLNWDNWYRTLLSPSINAFINTFLEDIDKCLEFNFQRNRLPRSHRCKEKTWKEQQQALKANLLYAVQILAQDFFEGGGYDLRWGIEAHKHPRGLRGCVGYNYHPTTEYNSMRVSRMDAPWQRDGNTFIMSIEGNYCEHPFGRNQPPLRGFKNDEEDGFPNGEGQEPE